MRGILIETRLTHWLMLITFGPNLGAVSLDTDHCHICEVSTGGDTDAGLYGLCLWRGLHGQMLAWISFLICHELKEVYICFSGFWQVSKNGRFPSLPRDVGCFSSGQLILRRKCSLVRHEPKSTTSEKDKKFITHFWRTLWKQRSN